MRAQQEDPCSKRVLAPLQRRRWLVADCDFRFPCLASLAFVFLGKPSLTTAKESLSKAINRNALLPSPVNAGYPPQTKIAPPKERLGGVSRNGNPLWYSMPPPIPPACVLVPSAET